MILATLDPADVVTDAVGVHRLAGRDAGEADVAAAGPEEHRRQKSDDDVQQPAEQDP